MSKRSKVKRGVTRLVTDSATVYLISICAWCERDLDEDDGPVALPVESPPEVAELLDQYTLPIAMFRLATAGGRRVVAIVPAPGSEARKDGVSILFATCSDECARALREALDEEVRVGRLQLLTGPTSGTA